MEIFRIVLLTVAAIGIIWMLYREYEREHQRQILAKKNMSFLESLNLTGLPIISFTNNGKTVNMVLDTGSNVCIINKKTLKDLNHEVSEEFHVGVTGISGESEGGIIVTLPLAYRDMEFDFECYVNDLSDTMDTIKKEYGVTIHGILGTGFFTKYKYILDFNSMIAYSLKKN